MPPVKILPQVLIITTLAKENYSLHPGNVFENFFFTRQKEGEWKL